jgi:hypothetical protein
MSKVDYKQYVQILFKKEKANENFDTKKIPKI